MRIKLLKLKVKELMSSGVSGIMSSGSLILVKIC